MDINRVLIFVILIIVVSSCGNCIVLDKLEPVITAGRWNASTITAAGNGLGSAFNSKRKGLTIYSKGEINRAAACFKKENESSRPSDISQRGLPARCYILLFSCNKCSGQPGNLIVVVTRHNAILECGSNIWVAIKHGTLEPPPYILGFYYKLYQNICHSSISMLPRYIHI